MNHSLLQTMNKLKIITLNKFINKTNKIFLNKILIMKVKI